MVVTTLEEEEATIIILFVTTPTSIGIILGITLTITTSQYFYFKDIVFDNKEDDVYINDVIYNVSNYWGVSYKFCN